MGGSDLRTQSLDLLRFPLVVVVLTIHVFTTEGFTLRGTEYSFESMPIFLTVNHFIDGFLRGQSVPIYFFISGFVFFLGIELTKENYIKKLKNRMKTLLIPYIIWNTLAILLQLFYFLPWFSSIFPNLDRSNLDLSPSAILYSFWDARKGILGGPISSAGDGIYPLNVPLWFVRDLMIVVLCAPILYWLFKRTRYYVVALLGVLWFVLSYWHLGHLNMLSVAFFFFSLGAYMSVNKKDMFVEFGRFFKASIILYPLLALLYVASVYYFPEFSSTLKRLNVIVGLLFAYNIAAWLLTHNICKASRFLAASSFFIYVSHYLICGQILKILFYFIRPSTDIGMLTVYVLTVLVTVALLLLVFYLLRKYTPGLLKLLAGRK